jgi:hypothetical protein
VENVHDRIQVSAVEGLGELFGSRFRQETSPHC